MSEQDAVAEEPEEAQIGAVRSCRRCERKQGLVGKYNIWLCRQCFREIARPMGFRKYQ